LATVEEEERYRRALLFLLRDDPATAHLAPAAELYRGGPVVYVNGQEVVCGGRDAPLPATIQPGPLDPFVWRTLDPPRPYKRRKPPSHKGRPHKTVEQAKAEGPPVMTSWLGSGAEYLGRPEPPPTASLAPIHAAAVERFDAECDAPELGFIPAHNAPTLKFRPRRPRARRPQPTDRTLYSPLYDGILDVDPLDLDAHRMR